MGQNPQVPLAHSGEDRRLHDGVGVEVVKLHPIVVHERTHKAAGRNPKPPVQKCQEANHIARWQVWLPIIHRGNEPFWRLLVRNRTEKSA